MRSVDEYPARLGPPRLPRALGAEAERGRQAGLVILAQVGEVRALPREEQARINGLRTLHIWATNACVRDSNARVVDALATAAGTVVVDILAVNTGSKCARSVGDVGQLPARPLLCVGLPVVITVNGGGHPELTRPLGIANGTRGVVMAILYAPGHAAPEQPQAVVVDVPTYRGPPIAPGWPPTWCVITPVTKPCDRKCCTRTSLAMQSASNVTCHKCQGITCGEDHPCQHVHVHFSDAHDPEQMRMPRSFYVAISRPDRGRNITFETRVTMEFLQRINNASWRRALAKEEQRVDAMADATLARVRHHTTDAGWLKLLARLDTAADDGIEDAMCAHPRWGSRERCAAKHCAYCRESLRTASAPPPGRPGRERSAAA